MNETLISSTTSSSSTSSSSSLALLHHPQINHHKQQQKDIEELLELKLQIPQQIDFNNKNSLTFLEILQIFNSAISQEQAWAALYQILYEFKYLFENCLNLVYLNQDYIDLMTICFRKDGTIYFSLSSKNPNQEQQEIYDTYDNNLELDKQELEKKILKSIAYLIYDALDYGNKFENEPDLQSSLADLLLLISGHYNEYSHKATEYDEGYEQEDEDTISIDRALSICVNNVTEAEYHYKAVCRALYAQAYELKVFLEKIVESKKAILMNGKDQANYCFEILNKADWAKLWMQVIHELRNGVKLRKVCEVNQHHRHIEYELTPFEILLDQIRSKRYHLRKVVLDFSIAPEVKKDARDIILEFIRSRPPLKPVKLNESIMNTISEPLSKHEKLMQSIRSYSTPLRKAISNSDSFTNENLNSTMNSCKKILSINHKPKRLLKADKNISNISDDEEIDEKDLIYIENISNIKFENNYSNSSFNYSLNTQHNNTNQRKRLKPAEALTKSPLIKWNEPVEEWRALVTEDIFDKEHIIDSKNNLVQSSSKNYETPIRRYTLNVFDMKNKFNTNTEKQISRNRFSLNANNKRDSKVSNSWILAKNKIIETTKYMKSGPGFGPDFGFVSIQELVKKLNESTDCLKLTFNELCHIRNVLTKAELDYLLFDNRLYNDVSKGKVCFSCRKTRFHLFNWGCKCRICKQRVCKKCLQSAQLKNGQVNVPLSKLCPSKFRSPIHKDTDSNNDSINDNDSELSSEDVGDDDQSSTNNDDNKDTIKRIDFDYDSPLESNQSEFFEICVDCYDIMSGLIVKTHDLNRPKSPTTDLLKMQPIFTRLTTSPVVSNIKISDSNISTPSNNNQIFSRNSLKLDLKPVYTNNQTKNP